MKKKQKLSGTIETQSGLSSANGTAFTMTGTCSFPNYHPPIIIDTIVFNDRIEIVYKCELAVTTHYTIYNFNQANNYPKIYKIIYSRTDGTMQTFEGKYIPPQEIEESYEF